MSLGALFGVVLRVEPVDGDFGEVGIGVVAGAVFVGEALGFGHDVEGLRRLETHAAEIEVLEDVEHLQSGEALGVGVHTADVDAAVVGDEGIEPLGLHVAEVFFGEPAADAFEVGIDSVGDGAFVEGVASAFGDQLIGTGEVGIAADVVFVGGRAAGSVGVHGVDGFFDAGSGTEEGREVALDVPADDLGVGRAVFAVMDGGLEELSPLELAVALMESPPSGESAGSGDGDGAEGRDDSVFSAGADGGERKGARGFAGAGHADDFGKFWIPDEGVAIAAETGAGGLHEAEAGIDGDSGVNGRSTALEHVNADLGGDGVGGSGRAVAAEGGGAGGETGAGGSIAGMDIGAEEAVVGGGLEFGEFLVGIWGGAGGLGGGYRNAGCDGGSGYGEREGGEELAAAHRYRLQVTWCRVQRSEPRAPGSGKASG